MSTPDGRKTKELFRQMFAKSGRPLPPRVEKGWDDFIAQQDRNRRERKIVKFAVVAVITLCIAAMTVIILRNIWP